MDRQEYVLRSYRGLIWRHRVAAVNLGRMNPARATDEGYIDFPIGSPTVVSATEAARVQPAHPLAPAHDSFTRLLHRLEPDPATLWGEVERLIRTTSGVLVIDDSTLDKPRARHIDPVGHHWSGNHHAVARGINLITDVWSDGDRLDPCDYRVYHRAGDGKTKNDHFADLLAVAHTRGFRPRAVLFDGWYASVENLKRVRDFGWVFVTRFEGNRKIRIDYRALAEQPIATSGTVDWLPGSGEVRVFRVVAPQTATRRTGLPTASAWTSWADACSPNSPGRSRNITGVETVHSYRTVPGPGRPGPTQSPRVRDPGVRPVEVPSVHHRGELVRRQVRPRP
jgi:hypothetical protein